MKLGRRDALTAALFGGGMLGMRSLATGLPVGFLKNPDKALADMQGQTCTGTQSKAQFLILNTLGTGDPIGCNAPGTYDDPTSGVDLSSLAHPDGTAFPTMAPTAMTIGGRKYTAAQAWTGLGSLLPQTTFFHLMTDTPVHPKEPNVLELMGATPASEMFPSVLSKALAPCLGTLQPQPVSIGASSPSEALQFGGQALPIIPPSALKATLTNPAGPLTNLQPLRDATLQKMHDYLAGRSLSVAQKQYIDSMIITQQQVRGIKPNTLALLDNITGNTPADQITAAVALIQMKVSPVIAVRIPFGGDNHSDAGLKNESTQTTAGVQTIVSLFQQLASAGLQDSVSFISLNVFGRTMNSNHVNGRDHNGNHQMSLMIGKPFKNAVIGGVGPVGNDWGCLGVSSASGLPQKTGGDVAPIDTLASWAKTVMAGVGIDQATIDAQVMSGKVIPAALA